jgi:hypothetical protein
LWSQEAAAVAAEKAYSTKVKIEIGEEAIKVANEQIDRDTAVRFSSSLC